MTIWLSRLDRQRAISLIIEGHYSGSVPSGKTEFYRCDDAFIAISVPANCNISSWLVGKPNAVWELSRLWAPNGHEPNLLSRAVSAAAAEFHRQHPDIDALISYADPNAGHTGGVYRASSWTYLGQCEESRAYRCSEGRIVSRRAFHSGKRGMNKGQIIAAGYVELSLPGKHRFARGLTRHGRKAITMKAAA